MYREHELLYLLDPFLIVKLSYYYQKTLELTDENQNSTKRFNT